MAQNPKGPVISGLTVSKGKLWPALRRRGRLRCVDMNAPRSMSWRVFLASAAMILRVT